MREKKDWDLFQQTFDNKENALEKIENAIDIINKNLLDAITEIERLEPKKAIKLIKEAAQAGRLSYFACLWMRDN